MPDKTPFFSPAPGWRLVGFTSGGTPLRRSDDYHLPSDCFVASYRAGSVAMHVLRPGGVATDNAAVLEISRFEARLYA